MGLREETGVQRSLIERLTRSRLQWAGHVGRMADDRLSKSAAELREQGLRRRGRQRRVEILSDEAVKREIIDERSVLLKSTHYNVTYFTVI